MQGLTKRGIMKTWEELTEQEQDRIAYDWIQCEGYTGDGEETDSAEEFYYASRPQISKMIGREPFQKGDLGVGNI